MMKKSFAANPAQLTNKQSKQKGVALLMTLLVLAVVTLALNQLQGLTQQDIELLQARHLEQQGWGYLLGAEILASQALTDSRIREQPRWWSSLRGEPLYYPLDDEGLIRMQVKDLRTCFNLNHLASIHSQESSDKLAELLPWRLYLHQLQEEGRWLEDLSFTQFLDLARDWIDRDSLALPEGAETGQYLLNNPPRLAANQALVDLSEVNWLGAENRQRFRQLPTNLCLVPASSLKLNINTLAQQDLPLLWAMFEGQVSLASLEDWWAERPEVGYTSLEDFWQELGTGNLPAGFQEKHANSLMLVSDFYQVNIQLQLHELQLDYQAEIHLSSSGHTQIYTRRHGTQDGRPSLNNQVLEDAFISD